MKSRKNRALRRRRKLQNQRRAAQIQYDNLEARCLLATDVGLAFTGSTFQTDSSYAPPDANGDIGPNHMIEVLNGRLNMIDKATGVRVQSHTMTGFFNAAGATVFNDPINPKVVYDRLTELDLSGLLRHFGSNRDLAATAIRGRLDRNPLQ